MSTKTADGRTVTTRPHEPLQSGQCAAITQSVLRCSRSAQWDELCFQHWAIEEKRVESGKRPWNETGYVEPMGDRRNRDHRMSYADDLLDQTPAPQREGFTNFPHWRVTQTGPRGGTTNWFSSYAEAAFFQLDHGGTITGVSCEEFESAWPWPRPHLHGASPDGERQEATEPTPQSDARRSQRLGRLI